MFQHLGIYLYIYIYSFCLHFFISTFFLRFYFSNSDSLNVHRCLNKYLCIFIFIYSFSIYFPIYIYICHLIVMGRFQRISVCVHWSVKWARGIISGSRGNVSIANSINYQRTALRLRYVPHVYRAHQGAAYGNHQTALSARYCAQSSPISLT